MRGLSHLRRGAAALALAVGIVVGISLGSSERQAATIQNLQRDVAAIRAERLEPAFGNLDRLGSGDSRQVYSVSPKGWKRPILYDDGRQVLVVKGLR